MNIVSEHFKLKKMKTQEKQRYVDILSNSGFKAVFGDQDNKPVLIDFLNAVLPEGRRVKDLTYATTEIEGLTQSNKSVKLDLRCEDEDGTSFIIEMQRYDQENFFKRCVSYSSKVYDMKTIKGDDNYNIPPVYLIGILAVDCFDRSKELWKEWFISDYTFREKLTGEVVCDTISLIFVELKRFDKRLEDCRSIIDKWCYALKYMSKLDSLPIGLRKSVFQRLFQAAEIAQFSPEKREKYEHDMITERDEINIRRTAEQKARAEGVAEGMAKGKAEGRKEGMLEVAKSLLVSGMSKSDVSRHTGLTESEVVALLG